MVLCRMWATGNAVGGLPLSVETPFEIVCWGAGLSLRLGKDLLRSVNRLAPGSVICIALGSFEASGAVARPYDAWNYDLRPFLPFVKPRVCMLAI